MSEATLPSAPTPSDQFLKTVHDRFNPEQSFLIPYEDGYALPYHMNDMEPHPDPEANRRSLLMSSDIGVACGPHHLMAVRFDRAQDRKSFLHRNPP